ncbi:cadherin EGF LAG seven-pass G-type receptor [Cricetulus griseus]|uniref:Cadherin EGF LAG seven-pass G-type receptor n=1 Tax=Cricetulus griseus TaxID=10029 RepID=A0A061IQZ4_CRIGR|nr:cadherin EGF LAG seven-pass G-type receptor [Cricetulus griseus]
MAQSDGFVLVYHLSYALVFSNIVADIQILINPVNLPENSLPGTELSRAYDKDVAGKPNAYRFLNKTKDFVIDEMLVNVHV